MAIVKAVLWQIAFILILACLQLTTAFTFTLGAMAGYWFCIFNIALLMRRFSDEQA
jgi:hypothetical protein